MGGEGQNKRFSTFSTEFSAKFFPHAGENLEEKAKGFTAEKNGYLMRCFG